MNLKLKICPIIQIPLIWLACSIYFIYLNVGKCSIPNVQISDASHKWLRLTKFTTKGILFLPNHKDTISSNILGGTKILTLQE